MYRLFKRGEPMITCSLDTGDKVLAKAVAA